MKLLVIKQTGVRRWLMFWGELQYYNYPAIYLSISELYPNNELIDHKCLPLCATMLDINRQTDRLIIETFDFSLSWPVQLCESVHLLTDKNTGLIQLPRLLAWEVQTISLHLCPVVILFFKSTAKLNLWELLTCVKECPLGFNKTNPGLFPSESQSWRYPYDANFLHLTYTEQPFFCY